MSAADDSELLHSSDTKSMNSSDSESLESSASVQELELVFEGASEEEEEAAAIIGSTISGGRITAETSIRGSRRSGSRTIQRGYCSWFDDYLSDTPSYPAHIFRQVFRIPLKLYCAIHNRLIDAKPRLAQQKDAVSRPGHTSHQKMLSSLRRLATGAAYRDMENQARMIVEALLSSFHAYIDTMRLVFGPRYLNREPNYA
jgi:hypothetical protein